MHIDRTQISPQAIEARIRAAREERSRTIKSYFANRRFLSRVIDTVKNREAPAAGSGEAPATAQ